MGCDIHAYIEYRNPKYPDQKWRSFGGRIDPGREYDLFGRIAEGVRSAPPSAIALRGLPEDIGYRADEDAYRYVSDSKEDSRYVTPEKAEKWKKFGSTYKPGTTDWISHPDWHSHSWINADELAEAINDTKPGFEYLAVLAAMRTLNAHGLESRLVFWFDN